MRSVLRAWLGAAIFGLTCAAHAQPAPEQPSVAKKVLRYAFEIAETGLDPAKIGDLYSRTITPHIFEALYTYDHLARPVKIKPLTADELVMYVDRNWPKAPGRRRAMPLSERNERYVSRHDS